MFEKWIVSQWGEIGMVLVSAVVTYGVILAYTRLLGLRSFSKMSASDFAMTVAVGSLFASTISSASPTLVIGIVSLGTLFGGQWLIAFLRKKSQWFSHFVDNKPILLMAGSQILDENLEKANVTRADLFGKLREANALQYDQVIAVIFETTGDISVLHSEDVNATVESEFLQDVLDSDRLFQKSAQLSANDERN